VEDGLAGLGAAVAAAHAALEIARRLGRRGELEAPEATMFEQAILAERELLEHGVATILAPLATTPRTGSLLVETLRVFLETAGNRRETARRLGLAPRTVAYRLRRIEARLGVRLEGRGLLRLGAALFALALLGPDADVAPPPADPAGAGVSPSRGPSQGPSRR
jgi:DNA-binding PucR family transcriptional regulator